MSHTGKDASQGSGSREKASRQPDVGYYLEDLTPGMMARAVRQATAREVEAFCRLTGDDNPLHWDDSFAAGTRFGRRIAPGLFAASLVAGLLGSRLPGAGAVYLGQDLRFLAPVYLDDTVTASVTVKGVIAEKGRVLFETCCHVGERQVLDGEARVLVPRRG